jgi:hypothetical protein
MKVSSDRTEEIVIRADVFLRTQTDANSQIPLLRLSIAARQPHQPSIYLELNAC